MANKSQFQAIKGTRDLLPPETALWNQVEQVAREVFATFHFGEIRLPIFEPTDLFARAVGGDTDIVGKEMYTFEDRPENIQKPHLIMDYEPFLESVKKSFESGAIPATDFNRDTIRRFEEAWRDANAQPDAPIDKGKFAIAFFYAAAI